MLSIKANRVATTATAVLVLVSFAQVAGAQTTWIVDSTHPNAPGSGTLADPYTSIQFAISQSSTISGDAISVLPGVYFEKIDFLGKQLNVHSQDGAATTIIDAGGTGSVVTVANGEPNFTQITGFTLQGGSGTYDSTSDESRGGAVYCVDSSLQIHDCTLKNNATVPPGGSAIRGAGGAVYAFNSDAIRLQGCTVENNSASRGGAAWIEQSDALVFWSAITDNTAVATDLNNAGIGGGLGLQDSNLNFDGCFLERNEAEAGQFVPARGGGILAWNTTGGVLNSIVADNLAGTTSTTQFTGQGGGIEIMFLDSPSDFFIAGCEIRNNRALNGGGFFGTSEFNGNLIHDNHAQSGAGIYSFGIEMFSGEIYSNSPLDPSQASSGLGIFTEPGSDSLVESSQIYDHSGMGTGIGVYGGDFLFCTIKDNLGIGTSLSKGGGAALATLTSCWLSGNRLQQTGTPTPMSEGGALWSCNATRCVLWNNQADQGGGASASSLLHCTVGHNLATNGSLAGGTLGGGTSNSCILWGNEPEDVANGSAEFSNVGTGLAGGLGNISTDPLFWQPPNNDYRLRMGSACIDTGNPNNPADLDGTPPDMGALMFVDHYYSPPFVYCTPKVNSEGCTPNLFTTGAPRVSAGTIFRVQVDNVINQKSGLMFWSRTSNSAPFQGGTLCVGAPITRTQVQSSGGNTGTTDCSGSYSFHWSVGYIQSQGLVPGDRVFAQYWSRDPGASFNVGLSAGVDFTLIP